MMGSLFTSQSLQNGSGGVKGEIFYSGGGESSCQKLLITFLLIKKGDCCEKITMKNVTTRCVPAWLACAPELGCIHPLSKG